ncbi:hypothetical protein QTP88_005996 [Uroleucon formosanum]
MQLALEDVTSKSLSINKASIKYSIPKSTLSMKLSGKTPLARKMGPCSFLSDEEENRIKAWILNNATLGFPLREEDVKDCSKIDKCISKTSKITSSVNKSDLSPSTIEESWSKHLFWPKPDTKKKTNRSQVKLSFAVTAIKWREYHANKEQEKLRKEEELTQKRKHREEIKK